MFLMPKSVFLLTLIFILPIFAAPVISEFMASNETTLADEDGDFSDWIEIYNPDDEPVDLAGYFLSDDVEVLKRWVFPATTLEAGAWLVVFASGKDRDVGEFHTDFKLSAGGEYLALGAPDGATVVSGFGARYPPQFEDKTFGVGEFGTGYLDEPTPGTANREGQLPGPLFFDYRTGGERPSPAESLVVTATVTGADDVTLFFRRGFSAEEAVAMTSEDGENFRVTIDGGIAGELIRWRFVAQDVDGRVTKEPPFRDPGDSHEYYGVPVVDPGVASLAEVAEWFILPSDYDRLVAFQPVRAGFFYLGEYYDNVRFSLRGQSTLFFKKKGFNLDFNKSHRFRWREGEPRVKDIDLLTNWGDKAKIRNEMAYEIMREAGVPTHFAFTIRLQRNRRFFSLTDMVEDADEVYLERAGLDPEGTLYKATNTSLIPDDIGKPGVIRKMTREDDGLGDFHNFIRALNRDDPEKWNYIFDQVDLPMTINTLAGLVVIMQTDMGAKNYYLYHDTEGDGQWAILPWDLDLTFGRNFTSRAGYFDRNMFFQGYTEFAESGETSSLVESLLRGNPRTRQMFFRRLRTLSDQFIASEYIPERSEQQLARLSPNLIFPADALRDSFEWGTWYDGNSVPQAWNTTHPDAETIERANNRITGEWLPLRRVEIYNDLPDLPDALESPAITIGALDFDPISDDQSQEFVELINQSPSAADVSGWSIDGAIRITLPPGTVIPSGGSLFLSPDKAAFCRREFSPTGKEQRFLIGPYSGNLAAEGETLELFDAEGIIRDRHTFSGRDPGFNGDSREDRDRDGINAIFEWALGSSDRVYNVLSLPVHGTFSYSVRTNLNGSSVVVESSQDLISWSEGEVTEISRISQDDGLDAVTVGLPGASGRSFIRIRFVR